MDLAIYRSEKGKHRNYKLLLDINKIFKKTKEKKRKNNQNIFYVIFSSLMKQKKKKMLR